MLSPKQIVCVYIVRMSVFLLNLRKSRFSLSVPFNVFLVHTKCSKITNNTVEITKTCIFAF